MRFTVLLRCSGNKIYEDNNKKKKTTVTHISSRPTSSLKVRQLHRMEDANSDITKLITNSVLEVNRCKHVS